MKSTQLKKSQQVKLTYYPAMTSLLSDIDRVLKDLVNPLYKSKENQDKLIAHMYKLIDDWYRITKQCLKSGDIVSDGSGILSNTTIYGTEKGLKANPYSKLIPLYIQKLIDNDEESIMTKSTDVSKDVVVPAEAVNSDVEWNKPYISAIEEVLSKLNDVDIKDTSAVKTLNSQLKASVRKWVDATYKSIINVKDDNRLKTDVAGVLAGKTVFSSPEYIELYDNSAEVDAIIELVSKKHKEKLTGNEVAIHTMAEAIAKAQDESATEFEVDTGDGESVHVDKTTGDVSIKKDNVVVRTAKAAYQGVVKFFLAIFNKLKEFGSWIASWLPVGKKEEPIVMSKEEADAYDAKVEQAAKDLKAA